MSERDDPRLARLRALFAQARAEAIGEVPGWRERCQKSKTGAPLANLFNTTLALRHDPIWAGQIRFDQMQRDIFVNGAVLNDAVTYQIRLWLQANDIHQARLADVEQALALVAQEHAFHPVRDWLDELQWDGQPRLAGWLTTYLGTADDEYHRQIACNFLKQMVARIYQPGCKADYMLVLYGQHRIHKSEVCRTLAGDDYFSDNLPDIGGDHVRVSMHLRGKWLIEISELAAISSSKVEGPRLKAFLSSPVEEYVAKFAHYRAREPRTCVFVGTTNEEQFSRDASGFARFWAAACGVINIDALRRDRDQLFAEAVLAYHDTKQWWPDHDIENHLILPAQENHFEADAWEEPVNRWLADYSSVSLMQVAQGALHFLPSQFNVGEQRRLAAILRRLGWKLHRSAKARTWNRYDASDA